MTFISLGTVNFDFKRLVEVAIEYSKKKNKEKVYLQIGHSLVPNNIPKNLIIKKFFTYENVIALLEKANTIVVASGESVIIDINNHSKVIPILFPRRKKYKEHVDDQQFFISKEAKIQGLGTVALTKKDLLSSMLKKQITKKKQKRKSSAKDIAKEITKLL